MRVVFVDTFSHKKYSVDVRNDETVRSVKERVIEKKLRMLDVKLWHHGRLFGDDQQINSHNIPDGDEILVEYERMSVSLCDQHDKYKEYKVTIQRNGTVLQLIEEARNDFRFDGTVRLKHKGQILRNADTMDKCDISPGDELMMEYDRMSVVVRDVDKGETRTVVVPIDVSVKCLLQMIHPGNADEYRLRWREQLLKNDDRLDRCGVGDGAELQKECQWIYVTVRDGISHKIRIQRNTTIRQLVTKVCEPFRIKGTVRLTQNEQLLAEDDVIDGHNISFKEEIVVEFVGGMNIFVRIKNSGKLLIVQGPAGASFGEFCEKIRREFGDACILTFRGKRILSDEDMASCHIADGDVIELHEEAIYVRVLVHHWFSFPYKSDMTVKDLMQDVSQKLGQEINHNDRILYNNKSLECDNRTLSDYGIKPNDCIDIIKYLGGDCPPVKILAVSTEGESQSVSVIINCMKSVRDLRWEIAKRLDVSPMTVTLKRDGLPMKDYEELTEGLGETIESIRSNVEYRAEYRVEYSLGK